MQMEPSFPPAPFTLQHLDDVCSSEEPWLFHREVVDVGMSGLVFPHVVYEDDVVWCGSIGADEEHKHGYFKCPYCKSSTSERG